MQDACKKIPSHALSRAASFVSIMLNILNTDLNVKQTRNDKYIELPLQFDAHIFHTTFEHWQHSKCILAVNQKQIASLVNEIVHT